MYEIVHHLLNKQKAQRSGCLSVFRAESLICLLSAANCENGRDVENCSARVKINCLVRVNSLFEK